MKWERELMRMSEDEIISMSKEYSATSTQFNLGFIQKYGLGSRICAWAKRGGSRTLIDFTSGIGWYNLGHNHTAFNKVLQSFLVGEYSNLPDHDWPSPFAAMLKKKLAEITPGDFRKKVFLARGGTEAIECALKLVADAKGARNGIFCFNRDFHGRTLGSLRLNHSKEIHWKGFVDEKDKAAALTYPAIGDHNCSLYRSDFAKQIVGFPNWNHPSALFFEPVQGEGGINVPCKDCLQFVINWFREFGALIVADEVQTGMMRTGTMFACEQLGIVPDIICLAKSLSPGQHLSATAYSSDLDFKEPGRNSNTGVDAKACAVALTMIELLENLDRTELQSKIQKLSTVAPEGLGMFRRVVLPSAEEKVKLVERAAAHEPVGLLLLPAGEKNVRLMPPLNISDGDLDEGIEIFKSLL